MPERKRFAAVRVEGTHGQEGQRAHDEKLSEQLQQVCGSRKHVTVSLRC
jgi:hypothetical protein